MMQKLCEHDIWGLQAPPPTSDKVEANQSEEKIPKMLIWLKDSQGDCNEVWAYTAYELFAVQIKTKPLWHFSKTEHVRLSL